MRTLFILMVVSILILAVGTAAAETPRQVNDPSVDYETWNPLLRGSGHATLQLSPMFLDIYQVNETSLVTEQELLAQLAATQDEHEVARLVARIERLDTDRQLSVLKIRVKYAQLGGQYDLVFRLRKDILSLMQQETDPLM